jgi:hypothetical protein
MRGYRIATMVALSVGCGRGRSAHAKWRGQRVARSNGWDVDAARDGVPGSSLPMTEDQAEAARAAFALSCPGLMRRTDASGLTQGGSREPAISGS